jgi:hypothetical protein
MMKVWTILLKKDAVFHFFSSKILEVILFKNINTFIDWKTEI